MRLIRQHGFAFLAGLIAGGFMLSSLSAQLRSGRTATLLTTDLSDWCDGKQVTVELNEFGPGTSGRHYHPGHSFTWILEGSETYAVDGKAPRVVKSGDVLHEEPEQVHRLDNDAPVKLLVFRIIEKGKPLTVAVP